MLIKMNPMSIGNNRVYTQHGSQETIPSPEEWVQEHYLLANAVQTLRDLQAANVDGAVFVNSETRELLRSHYNEEHWQQIERYFSKS
ncbi:MAG: hypothetical protein ACRC8A_15925 [Microcoleaceae cyanobacterium]